MGVSLLLVITVALALGFAFANGVHDTSSTVATSVATRAMTPRAALLVATVANLLGGLASTAVATTIGTRLFASDAAPSLNVLIAALTGAIAWTLLSWYLALPSSASYALIGGLLGAATMASGFGALRFGSISRDVLVPALLLPVLALGLSYVILRVAGRLLQRAPLARAFAGFRLGQVGSASLVGFAHGLADAQKTMGVIALALVAADHESHFLVPRWTIVASAATVALGTFAGGLRHARKRGFRVHRVEPPQGFATQAAASLAVLYASALGFPVSTTHALAGASIGTRRRDRFRSLRDGIGLELVLSAVASALVSALIYLPLRLG